MIRFEFGWCVERIEVLHVAIECVTDPSEELRGEPRGLSNHRLRELVAFDFALESCNGDFEFGDVLIRQGGDLIRVRRGLSLNRRRVLVDRKPTTRTRGNDHEAGGEKGGQASHEPSRSLRDTNESTIAPHTASVTDAWQKSS